MRGRAPGIGRYFNRSLEVRRPQEQDDGHGGKSTIYVTVGTVRGKVDQPSPTERLLAEQSQSRHSHNIYLRPAADVQRGDHLVGSDSEGIAQTFRVQSVVKPSYSVYAKAFAELIQRQGA